MKLIEMSDYNRAAKTYWTVMVIAGTSVFLWAIRHSFGFSPAQWGGFAGLLSLVILAGANPIRIPNTRSSFTAGDVFIFLGILFLGIPAAIVIGASDALVGARRTSKRATSWIAAPAMMALTVFIAGKTFYFALAHYVHVAQQPLGTTPIPLDRLLGALGLLAMVHYFINGFTISTI